MPKTIITASLVSEDEVCLETEDRDHYISIETARRLLGELKCVIEEYEEFQRDLKSGAPMRWRNWDYDRKGGAK
jgi:translation initiation factor 1 (eIF-1/SUI1)